MQQKVRNIDIHMGGEVHTSLQSAIILPLDLL